MRTADIMIPVSPFGDGLIQVDYRKYDGALHWNLRMRRLGEDEHGVWLGLPAGSVMRKGHNPEVPIPGAHVILFPRDAWWTAVFNAAPRSGAIRLFHRGDRCRAGRGGVVDGCGGRRQGTVRRRAQAVAGDGRERVVRPVHP